MLDTNGIKTAMVDIGAYGVMTAANLRSSMVKVPMERKRVVVWLARDQVHNSVSSLHSTRKYIAVLRHLKMFVLDFHRSRSSNHIVYTQYN